MEMTAWLIFLVLAGYTASLKNEESGDEGDSVLDEAERIIKRECLFDYNPEKHREQLKGVLATGNRNNDNFDLWCHLLPREEWLKKQLEVKEAESEITSKKVDGVYYIAIKEFSLERTVGDFIRAAMEGVSHNSPFIVDLRDNRGGIIDAVVHIASMFGKKGAMVAVQRYKNRTEEIRVLETPTQGIFSRLRVAILVNGWSASGAELFAGAMKDWGFPVVGQTSYGKGVGQYPFLLPDLSYLYLTTFEYLVGSTHTKVNKKGIEPDYRVADSRKLLPGLTATPKDRQFMKAVEVLKNMK